MCPFEVLRWHEKSFLIWAKLHHSDRILAQHVPVSSIVESWVNVTKSVGYDTVLVIDSYYLDKVGKQFWLGRTDFHRCTIICLKKINRTGEWSAINNPETFESALYYWSYEKNVGKKLVDTNAFQITTQFPEDSSSNTQSWMEKRRDSITWCCSRGSRREG
jgi:hypothetical protein